MSSTLLVNSQRPYVPDARFLFGYTSLFAVSQGRRTRLEFAWSVQLGWPSGWNRWVIIGITVDCFQCIQVIKSGLANESPIPNRYTVCLTSFVSICMRYMTQSANDVATKSRDRILSNVKPFQPPGVYLDTRFRAEKHAIARCTARSMQNYNIEVFSLVTAVCRIVTVT